MRHGYYRHIDTNRGALEKGFPATGTVGREMVLVGRSSTCNHKSMVVFYEFSIPRPTPEAVIIFGAKDSAPHNGGEIV